MFCPHLPPELLDHVVDSLRDSRDALKNCCLASKQWIPRTRKHLFANIQFRTAKDLESWKTVFPDPSTSPTCYTETLFIGWPHIVADAGAGEDCWLSAFSHVAHLGMVIDGRDVEQTTVFLIPFHGFSPILKSLSMAYAGLPYSQIINLIRSFPLLEDVSVDTIDCDGLDEQPTIIQPSTSPALTGSLQLCVRARMDPVVSRLLSLPNGLHFRKIDLKWHHVADTSSTTALVQGCRSTLESLKIDSGILRTLVQQPCPHQWLIFVCRRIVSAGQPQQGNETQRRGVYMVAGPSMDSQDAPNNHTRSQRAQTDYVDDSFFARPQ